MSGDLDYSSSLLLAAGDPLLRTASSAPSASRRLHVKVIDHRPRQGKAAAIRPIRLLSPAEGTMP